MLNNPDHDLLFSAASLWEVSIKPGWAGMISALIHDCFGVAYSTTGMASCAITSEHAIAVDLLPPIHKDPYDRMLLAQAMVEGIALLTSDPLLARYPGPVHRV